MQPFTKPFTDPSQPFNPSQPPAAVGERYGSPPDWNIPVVSGRVCKHIPAKKRAWGAQLLART
ncbi:MAG: hypothetical protein J2P36_14375, partial [Ktedonobacteraceae bacterium]|nr:hypothetical protein [Ktedonobacteraceae bacterium]